DLCHQVAARVTDELRGCRLAGQQRRPDVTAGVLGRRSHQWHQMVEINLPGAMLDTNAFLRPRPLVEATSSTSAASPAATPDRQRLQHDQVGPRRLGPGPAPTAD